MKRVVFVVCVAVLLFAASGTLNAQVPTGSITGTVADSSGLPVPAAQVKLTNQGTGREQTTQTSDLGRFLFSSLNSGVYKVTITVSGFKTHVSSDIKLDAGTQYSLPPIKLELGEVTSVVTVESGTMQVQTTDAQVSGTVDSTQLAKLPILDRNALNLLQLQAGVASNGTASTVIHGQRTSFASVTLDGINIQDNFIRSNALDFVPNRPTINTVSEFTVIQQNSGAEAGLGSAQVSFVTPSGTNEWHGQAYWYHRNNVLAANDWFNNRDDVPKPKLIQNQLGGSVGGPILHDKLFIYGEYEAFRRRQGAPPNTPATVLTPDARNGIFTYPVTCTTSCPSGINPGDIVKLDIMAATGNVIDPFIANLLTRVPTTINTFSVGDSTATQLFNTAGFTFNEASNTDRDGYTIRSDWNLTSKHSVTGTFRWNRSVSDRPDIDNTFNTVPVVKTTSSIPFISAAWRWTPSGRFTNEVRGGLSLNDPIFDTSEDFSAGFVLTGTIFTNPVEDFRRQGRKTNTYSLGDNASYVWGNHSLNFGYLNQWITVQSFTGFDIPPTCDIGNNNQGLLSSDFPGGASSSFRSRANALLATLAGFLDSCDAEFNVTSRTSGFSITDNVRNLRLNTLAFYGGDSWKLARNFTFNYGVRWDYIGRFNEKNGLFLLPVIPSGANVRDVIVDPNTVLDFAGGDSGRPIYNRDLNNFAPSIGLAWDVFGDGKTAVRAGYSIHFTNDEAIRAADNAAGGNNGLNTTLTVANLTNTISQGIPTFMTPSLVVPRTLVDTNAETGGLPNTIFTVDPHLATPYVQQWNLSIQREVGWRTVVDIKYVGNKGTALSRGVDYNQVIIGPNGFLDDFIRARNNGFLCDSLGMGFDVNCTAPGSQPLTVFPLLPPCIFGGGGLPGCTNFSFVTSRIEQGRVGDLAAIYHFNALEVDSAGNITVPFTANPLAGVADILQNQASSIYHAGVVEVRRQGARGLSFQANYTFSKVLTDSDGTGQTNFDPFLDFANPGLDRSRAEYDLAHAFKGNFVYELPFGQGHRWSTGNPVLSRFVSGWSIASIFTWQSGPPFSILSNRGTLNRDGRSTNKNTAVALVSQGSINDSLGVFTPSSGSFSGQVFILDPSHVGPNGRGVGDDAPTCDTQAFSGQLFCNPEPGTLGNLGRNAFNGPWFFNWDFSILKYTRVTERIGTEFRAEFFNFPNHPTFFTGNQNINSSTFGQVSSTLSSPRIIQMALKIVF